MRNWKKIDGSEVLILNSSKAGRAIFLAAVAGVLMYVIWNSPLTADDLYDKAFGLRSVKDIFHFAITYTNGRLLGNMLIHFILKSLVFRAVFQTIVLLALYLLTYKTANSKAESSFYVCIALFLTISPAIFREDYLWSSAFANYVPGIIAMFISFYCVKKKGGIISNIVLFAVSIMGQLFVEHTSLINIMFAFCALCYFIKTKAERSKIISSLVWLGGTVIGMGIMVILPKLFYVADEWENYQKLNLGSVHDLMVSVISNAMYIAGINLQNVFSLVIISVVIITITRTNVITRLVLLFVPFYGFIVSYIIKEYWTGTACALISLLIFLLYAATVIISIYREESIKCRFQVLFYIGMSVFSVLPLLVVYPIGSRCLLHSYVFLVLAVLSLINDPDDLIHKFNSKLKLICIMVTCFLLCYLAGHFHQVGIIDRARLQYVQDMMDDGAESITVPKIPSVYVRDNNGFFYGQVFYHKEKQDIKFEFIDYDEWKDLIGEQTYEVYFSHA